MHFGNELELCKTEKRVLSEFEGDHFWLKSFGPGGNNGGWGSREGLKNLQWKLLWRIIVKVSLVQAF